MRGAFQQGCCGHKFALDSVTCAVEEEDTEYGGAIDSMLIPNNDEIMARAHLWNGRHFDRKANTVYTLPTWITASSEQTKVSQCAARSNLLNGSPRASDWVRSVT